MPKPAPAPKPLPPLRDEWKQVWATGRREALSLCGQREATLKQAWLRWPDLRMLLFGTRAFHGFNTVWWTDNRDHLYRKPGSDLPCGPRGEMLMELSAWDFIEDAEKNAARYGTHGLDALAAAFHGNIVVKDGPKAGYPTTVESWDLVNELIDLDLRATPRSGG